MTNETRDNILLRNALQVVLRKLEEVNHCCVPCDDHMDRIMELCREALGLPSAFQNDDSDVSGGDS